MIAFVQSRTHASDQRRVFAIFAAGTALQIKLDAVDGSRYTVVRCPQDSMASISHPARRLAEGAVTFYGSLVVHCTDTSQIGKWRVQSTSARSDGSATAAALRGKTRLLTDWTTPRRKVMERRTKGCNIGVELSRRKSKCLLKQFCCTCTKLTQWLL